MSTIAQDLARWAQAGRTVVHEADAKALLTRAGIPVPLRNPLSGACAVKLCSDRHPHKTEHGLVKLNVSVSEAPQIGSELGEIVPDGIVLIEAMVDDGVAEWIIGCRHDPTFGPIVVIGVGGILVELVDEATARLAPLDHEMARRAIESQRAVGLLRGLRGKRLGDLTALVDLVTTVSQFFAEHAAVIEQIEINPVIVRPEGLGAVAADALIVLRSTLTHGRTT
jgi:acyl-CoA synthetase (NDP forming)